MRVTLRSVPLLDLSGAEVAECRRLTFGPDGLMERALDDLRGREPRRGARSHAILATDDAGRLVGWALVFPNRCSARFEAYFFVDEKLRRHGIGRQLAEGVRSLKPRHKLMVRPMNKNAWDFFASLPPTRFEPQDYEGWLRKIAAGECG